MDQDKAAAPVAEAKPVERVEVTLLKPHAHGGVDHPAGAKIRVRPDQRKRLAERRVIAE